MKNNIVALPKPPNWNRLYRIGKYGFYMSKDGRDWLFEAGLILKSQFKKRDLRNIAVYLKFYTIKSDIDAPIKIVNDLLEDTGIIKDDKEITFLQIEKIKVKHYKDEKIELEISY